MKLLILSDIHFPYTDRKRLAEIVNEERPDKTIFLGDNVRDGKYSEDFRQFIATIACGDSVLIKGDNELSLPYQRSLKLKLDGRDFTFIHGYQFNIRDDRTTGRIVFALKKVRKELPVLSYAIFSKVRSRTSGYLILGHSHAMAFFPRLKVTCAGCLTAEMNIYNDRGYVVISANEGRITLSMKRLDGRDRAFEL